MSPVDRRNELLTKIAHELEARGGGGIVYHTCSWAKLDLCSACCHSGPVEMLTAQLALTMAAANGGAQRIQEGEGAADVRNA